MHQSHAAVGQSVYSATQQDALRAPPKPLAAAMLTGGVNLSANTLKPLRISIG